MCGCQLLQGREGLPTHLNLAGGGRHHNRANLPRRPHTEVIVGQRLGLK
jgi:hypothetical protein